VNEAVGDLANQDGLKEKLPGGTTPKSKLDAETGSA